MIGIIGAFGNVGRQVIEVLDKSKCSYVLKCGSRNTDLDLVVSKNSKLEIFKQQVDLYDDNSLENFIKGCRIIVNCAGPSSKTSQRVVKMCEKNNCCFVDPGIGVEFNMLKNNNSNIVGIYGAGATPGLSGLLPIYFDKISDYQYGEVEFYMGFLGNFTKNAALDYLEGVLNSTDNMGIHWNNYKKETMMYTKRNNIELPLFSRKVTLFPYFDEESNIVAKTMNIKSGKWFIAVDNDRISNIMKIIRNKYLKDSNEAVNTLCSVYRSEMCGRKEYINFIVEGCYKDDNTTQYKTILMSTRKPSLLTGAVLAATMIEVLNSTINNGVQSLVELGHANEIINRLVDWDIVDLNIIDKDIKSLLEKEVGEI